ncbi:MAG: hypothetical protein E6J91_23305 [Deltaproteobacteria bacterium]|nr:MAG: hypothetical protein E6J91_23305 [Deltaproteobacteria bacterium]
MTQPTPPPELPAVTKPPTAPLAAPPTAAHAGARTTELLPIPRLTGPIQLDGIPDEPAWQAVTPVSFTTHWPEFGKAPREPTEARIAHDERYLYVAFRNGDSKPDTIKVTTLKRDSIDFPSQDLNCVLIDSFNDNENSLAFYTNPAGVRSDGAITHDATVTPALVSDPNFFWDVVTHRDAQGWSSEFRIPFSTLRYNVVDGKVTMGIILYRMIPRLAELSTFPAIEAAYNPGRPSKSRDVTLDGVPHWTPLYATPYLMGGYGTFTTLDATTMAANKNHQFPREIGGDVKYGVTSNFTLDATINPDFAQVEADSFQINLNRFNLFYPEKRSFFLERAAVLEVPLEGNDRLFYSRHIGIVGTHQVGIYGGLRGIGRFGDWDVGVMDLQTQDFSGVAPSENMGVVRLRRQVIDDTSYLGGLLTTRIGNNGSRNTVGSVDSGLHLSGDTYLELNLAHAWWRTEPTMDAPATSAGGHAIDDSFGLLRIERRSSKGLLYNAEAARSGPGFVPGLGFLERTNFARFAGRLGWGWSDVGNFRSQTLAMSSTVYTSNVDDSLQSALVTPTWRGRTKAGAGFGVSATFDRENVAKAFPLSDKVSIPAGHYSFASGTLSYSSPTDQTFSYQPQLTAGQYFDGKRLAPSLIMAVRATEHLVVSGSYTLNYIKLDAGQPTFVSHLGLVRLLVMLNAQLSLTTFAQINSIKGSTLVNARLRYNPSEGHDLYLVYDNGHSYDDRDPTLNQQTFLLKYSYTFDLSQ